MPKASVAKVRSQGPTNVQFSTEFHELEFADIGAGVAVLAPEWDGFALVLNKDDLGKLKALVDSVVSRP